MGRRSRKFRAARGQSRPVDRRGFAPYDGDTAARQASSAAAAITVAPRGRAMTRLSRSGARGFASAIGLGIAGGRKQLRPSGVAPDIMAAMMAAAALEDDATPESSDAEPVPGDGAV